TQKLIIFRTLNSTLYVLSPKNMFGLFFHVLNIGNDNMVFPFLVLSLFLLNIVREKSFSDSREFFGMAQRGNFSAIYRKVQLKPLKWDGEGEEKIPVEALMILKYGGVLAHAGRKQVFTYSTI
ncbi:hypothetical protein HID58_032977, partial [Brassica napus]